MTNAVVIASAGRPDQLDLTLRHLLGSVHGIDAVVVCVPDRPSIGAIPEDPAVKVLIGPRGAATQRNHALDHLPEGTDYVFFFDDDCLPHADYVVNGAAAFEEDAHLIGLTGSVLKDGARTAEVPVDLALSLLAEPVPAERSRRSAYGLYGCNFAVRRTALATERFDDRLPLYSWLEDEDLSRRLARRGALQVVGESVCVHLGAKSGGRTNHLRFGYSQVTNPIHLWRKGSITLRRTFWLIARPVTGNLLGVISTDRRDRVLRLRGNLLSAADVARGRVTPERILTL